MSSTANSVHSGLRTTATPYLCTRDASKALEFYKNAFGATEAMAPMTDPSGKIMHAEIKIGDALIMFADEFPDMGFLSPQALGGSAVTVVMRVEDVDTFTDRAVAAGAKLCAPVEDQFYGERMGKLIDPFGHVWMISTPIEEVTPEELHKRFAALYG
ncbi:MAG: VOC family protein [Aphanocapsa lilacina HA4352-LM1]|jgi:PhnB protein|nr:VOC family protein [Aphanocapsa lilacina HA4352-LM1]